MYPIGTCMRENLIMLYVADPIIVKNPVKVLILKDKKTYDNYSYVGRAEADIVAYGLEPERPFTMTTYKVVKNRLVEQFLMDKTTLNSINSAIRFEEIARFNRELADLEVRDKYKEHPYISLGKNETSD